MQWKTGMRSIGEVFNIGTGRPTRIKDLAETIIRISNKELAQVRTGADRGYQGKLC